MSPETAQIVRQFGVKEAARVLRIIARSPVHDCDGNKIEKLRVLLADGLATSTLWGSFSARWGQGYEYRITPAGSQLLAALAPSPRETETP